MPNSSCQLGPSTSWESVMDRDRWVGTHGTRPDVDPSFLLTILEPGEGQKSVIGPCRRRQHSMRAMIESRDRGILPTSALLLKHRLAMERIQVSKKLVDGLLLHVDGLDTFRLHLLHGLHTVLNRCFDLFRQSAVRLGSRQFPSSIRQRTEGRRVPLDHVAPGPTIVK